MKIANDMRWLASGPRTGIGELLLPQKEPGSSIMPGKVVAGSQGNFELNAMRPLIINSFLHSAEILVDGIDRFLRFSVADAELNRDVIGGYVVRSLMFVTALSPEIGYRHAASIAEQALAKDLSLRDAAVASGLVTAEQFDRVVDPAAMTGPRRRLGTGGAAAGRARVDGGPGAGLLGGIAESTPSSWRAADEYLVGHDPVLESALAAQAAAGLSAIEVAPVSGKLLSLLVGIAGARRVLESGHPRRLFDDLARAGSRRGRTGRHGRGGAGNAAVARSSIDAAGVGGRVEIRIGRGADVLPTLAGEESFDLVFVDADKESNTLYLDWAARLGRPGTVVVLDNVGREGEIVNESSADRKVRGTRAGLRMLGEDPRFDVTALQTVGVKGWGSVALAVVV